MLIGEYTHNIDAKGRVFMPAKFRDDLGETFIVTKGVGKCLFVFIGRMGEFLRQTQGPAGIRRGRSELHTHAVCERLRVRGDKQGRILLPQRLRDHIGVVKETVLLSA